MKVLVSQASVNTASVNIKTLTIKGKQVTLAVFRQIKEEMPKREHNPIIWGTVNYHTKDCRWGKHLHVVWQHGSELRKCEIYPKDLHGDVFLNCDNLLNLAIYSGIISENECGGNRFCFKDLCEMDGYLIGIKSRFDYRGFYNTNITKEEFEHRLSDLHNEAKERVDHRLWLRELLKTAEASPQLFIAV